MTNFFKALILIVLFPTCSFAQTPAELWDYTTYLAPYQSSTETLLRGTYQDANNSVYSWGVLYDLTYGHDGYMTVHDVDGNLIFSKLYDEVTGTDDEVIGVKTDGAGNVYAVVNINNKDATRIFKYSSTGSLIWEKTYQGAALNTHAMDMDVDQSTGDVYYSGTVDNTAGTEGYNILIVKYSAAGNLEFAKSLDGTATTSPYDHGYHITLDNSSNVYVLGERRTPDGRKNVLYKYNSAGTWQWTKAPGDTDDGDDAELKVEGANVAVYGLDYKEAFDIASGNLAENIIFDGASTLDWGIKYFKLSNGNYIRVKINDVSALELYTSSGTEINGQVIGNSDLKVSDVILDEFEDVYVLNYSSVDYEYRIRKIVVTNSFSSSWFLTSYPTTNNQGGRLNMSSNHTFVFTSGFDQSGLNLNVRQIKYCIPPEITFSSSEPMTPSVYLCPGESLDFGVTSQFGSSYTWSGTTSSSGNSATTVWMGASIPTYQDLNVSVTLDAGNGCMVTHTPPTFYGYRSVSSFIDDTNVGECESDPGSISATDPQNYYVYDWFFDGAEMASNSGTATYSLIHGSGTYGLAVTDTEYGCNSLDTNEVAITLNPSPNVTANATDTEICAGESVTLTGSGASTYVWDNGVTDGVVFSPSATNTYTVTGTDANGCSNTDAITVAVNALPNVTANATDAELCTGESVTLTGSGASTYTWDNGVTDGAAFSPSTTNTYAVTGTDANGCSNTDAITVAVNALPTVVANTTDAEVCAGESVTLTGSGASTYTWDNGVTDGAAFTPSATNTYTVTGTDANGCSNTDAITVAVNALPTVVANSTDTEICAEENVTLTGSGASTYVWDNGVTDGVAFSPSATDTYTVTGTDANGCSNTDAVTVSVNALDDASFNYSSGTYCLTGTNPSPTISGVAGGQFTATNGLVIDASTGEVDIASSGEGDYVVTYTTNGTCPNAETFNLTITSSPEAGFSYANASFCANDALTYLPDFDAGASAGVFSSDMGGLELDASNGEINPSLSVPGVYVITNFITASGGCSEASATYTVEIIAVDDASFSYDQSTYLDTDLNPTANITGLTGGVFTESTGNIVFVDNSTGEIDLSASTIGGPYEITYTTNGTCPAASTFSLTIEEDVAVNEEELRMLNVFPNPFQEVIHIKVEGEIQSELYDSMGKLILNTSSKEIQTAHLKPGVYLLNVTKEQKSKTVRLIKF